VPYDANLIMRILRGHRETIIQDTPIDYSNLYTGKYSFLFINIYYLNSKILIYI
jgi:hypothetical protein